MSDDRPYFAIDRIPDDFVFLKPYVERHKNRPALPNREGHDDKVRTIRKQHGNTFARFDARLEEFGGQTVDAFQNPAIGGSEIILDDTGFVWLRRHNCGETLKKMTGFSEDRTVGDHGKKAWEVKESERL